MKLAKMSLTCPAHLSDSPTIALPKIIPRDSNPPARVKI